jgi:signal peptidase I
MDKTLKFFRVLLRRHAIALLPIFAGLSILPSYLWAYSLSGASAAPTILLGDTVIVNHAAYEVRLPYSRIQLFRTGSPQRGELVQAFLPSHIGPSIKRVIALPGQTIEVRDNLVMIDGRPQSVHPLNATDFNWVPAAHRMGSIIAMEDRHWIAYTPGESRYRNSAPIQLGPNQYFLMGDNRDNSLDSRDFGPISRQFILGKVIAVLPTGRRTSQKRN